MGHERYSGIEAALTASAMLPVRRFHCAGWIRSTQVRRRPPSLVRDRTARLLARRAIRNRSLISTFVRCRARARKLAILGCRFSIAGCVLDEADGEFPPLSCRRRSTCYNRRSGCRAGRILAIAAGIAVISQLLITAREPPEPRGDATAYQPAGYDRQRPLARSADGSTVAALWPRCSAANGSLCPLL